MAINQPSSSGRVRVYVKKQLRLDLLNFDHSRMARLGLFGLADVLNRVRSGIGPEDGKAEPLSKTYAQRKSRFGLKNKRDLTGFGRGGHMLDNLKLSTVSKNEARIRFSTLGMRERAAGNEQREPFMVFSPQNVKRIVENARKIFTKELLPNVVKSIPG